MSLSYESFEAWAEGAQHHFVSWVNEDLPYDERITRSWPMTHLSQALVVLAAYGVLVAVGLLIRPAKYQAPKRDPSAVKPSPLQRFKSEPILIVQAVYNLVQVLLCLYMIVGTVIAHRQNDMSLICNKHDYKDVKIASMLWVFYVSKILDFCDTFFIVVRGAWDRFSFLHIYHHGSIFFVYWMIVNAGYAGDVFYTIVANSFIHLLMYYYYLQSSLGSTPAWGKYLTQLQMLQFITMNLQAGYILLNHCDYPRTMTLIYLFYIISLFALFMNFYLRKHSKKPKRA